MAVKKDYSVPYTGVRLKPYIAILMTPNGYDGTKDFTAADILSQPLVEVGSVTKFTYTNDREGGGQYRVFNRTAPGTVKETYPGLPTYKLTLDTVVLYKETFFETLGFGAADVGYQDKPQIIQLQLLAPDDVIQRTWTFWGSWIQNNPYEFEAAPGDLLLAQSLNINTAGIIEGVG